MGRNPVYFNAKQLEFLQCPQKRKTLVWGRGTGKGAALAGLHYQRMCSLPRAKFFLTSSTYGQILTKTLPPMLDKWHEIGLREGEHYLVGRRPPEHWDRPFKPPKKFENIISFANGYTIEMMSMDRPKTLRGGSFDGGDVDEAAFVSHEVYKDILVPSIRGNNHRFSHPLHQSICKLSSQPRDTRGDWIIEDKAKAKAKPELYFYSEATSWDNVDILGASTIQMWEDEMDYLSYQAEVMNVRFMAAQDPFYHRYESKTHNYTPAYKYHEDEEGIQVKGFADYNPKELLDISFDFGGWFNCAIAFQTDRNTERAVKSFHVKETDARVLVDNICKHYEGHPFKMVRVWGEPRGHDKMATGTTMFEIVQRRFQENGWTCQICVRSGYTRKHAERHTLLNEILEEVNIKLPKLRINDQECKDLIISMQLAEVGQDFTKNKSKEKDRNYPQEHATHYTDALDYFFVQKYERLMSGGKRSGSGYFSFQ